MTCLLLKRTVKIALIHFLNEGLLSATQDIFSPIKSQKLKTFSDQVKPKRKAKVAGKDVILYNNNRLLARLLVLGQSRASLKTRFDKLKPGLLVHPPHQDIDVPRLESGKR
ncbi:unnamed protein product [Caretta caretta]